MINIFNWKNQYLKAKNAATPALTHTSYSKSDGISKNITKLVEWPVVDNVPLLETTLYTGQLYIPVSGIFLSACGTRCNMGNAKNKYDNYMNITI